MSVADISQAKGSRDVLSRFSFKSSRRGAVLLGVGAGLMVWLQALAYAASYTTDLARAKFATSLASNPGLGIIYGEARHIETPAGYMVYRTMPFLGIIGAIWALSVSTRLLRGQEEDGRIELLASGQSTLGKSTRQTLLGMFISMSTAFAICAALLVVLGKSSKINVSPTASIFFSLGIFAPVLVFAMIGALTSQLANTRRRAMVYGIMALVGMYAIRAVGNVVHSLKWLKIFTPFGWIDKLHPVTGSNWPWFVPLIALSLACLAGALYFVSIRDFGESIIADKDTANPHFKSLNSPMGLSFRLNRMILLGWLIATIAICGLITGIAKTAVNAVGDSQSLSKALGNITGGNAALALAFISFSGFFIALMLMITAANGVGRIREDEAKGYLDNFLVNPVSRARWLIGRIVILIGGLLVICIISNAVTLYVARAQGISVSAYSLLWDGLNFIAPALLMLGVGILIFGIRPRLASIVLYAWITWSFIVEMIGAVVHLSSYVIDTSLLRQVSLVPSVAVDWRLFTTVSIIGVATAGVGLWLFYQRDLVSE